MKTTTKSTREARAKNPKSGEQIRKTQPAKSASASANANATTRAGKAGKNVKNVKKKAEGWHGWDDYATFYDWENARTVGRRDVAFWRGVAQRAGGRTLELGCGTGRVLLPLAKAGVSIVGIDRSEPMLSRARMRLRRLRTRTPVSASIVRGDIRQLPFASPAIGVHGAEHDRDSHDSRDGRARRKTAPPVSRGGFDLVIAPYGILQSLVRERDLTETLRAVARVLPPGGTFGLDLVPDVPRWQEYSRRVSLRGRRGPNGTPVTLIESVRQDRERGLTIFDQEFVEGAGRTRRTHRFSLTFRTVGIQPLRRRLERAGFRIDAVLGSYDGSPWDPRADVWVILASKV
jgi:SAM-dependent methyltransferase